ncbi:type II toxin-antitoxin system HicB family antitoxin [Pinirhizobacter sp.]|jgi:predicted RNase H-like HicB family nuclease|uniref:type II toxin-antitoxin system HicB family antitoxin n=1 Tax=Pinirhizobacter sp. TaxID=2950432 RepID=UPI002F3E96FC
MRYPIAIEPGDSTTAFGVVVPDVPGAFSAGDTLEEAIANAEDGILLALEEYLERGEAIPQPSQLAALIKRRDFKGWTWALADVDLAKLNGKAVRLNITLPERLLGTIDAFAKAHGETRSGFLARAAMQAMIL